MKKDFDNNNTLKNIIVKDSNIVNFLCFGIYHKNLNEISSKVSFKVSDQQINLLTAIKENIVPFRQFTDIHLTPFCLQRDLIAIGQRIFLSTIPQEEQRRLNHLRFLNTINKERILVTLNNCVADFHKNIPFFSDDSDNLDNQLYLQKSHESFTTAKQYLDTWESNIDEIDFSPYIQESIKKTKKIDETNTTIYMRISSIQLRILKIIMRHYSTFSSSSHIYRTLLDIGIQIVLTFKDNPILTAWTTFFDDLETINDIILDHTIRRNNQQEKKTL